MNKSIIGYRYEPLDNSWCINLQTRQRAYIVTDKPNSEFIITSEPYKVEVGNLHKEYEFINIKSINSNKEYRTLYFKKQVHYSALLIGLLIIHKIK